MARFPLLPLLLATGGGAGDGLGGFDGLVDTSVVGDSPTNPFALPSPRY